MLLASPVSLSSTPTMSLRKTAALKDSVMGLAALSRDHLISVAVTGRPLWNVASGRSRKVVVVPSGLTSHPSAKSPTMAKFWSMVISPPKISTAYRAELASVFRCGSRVGGSTPSLRKVPPSTALVLPWTSAGSAIGVGVDASPGSAVLDGDLEKSASAGSRVGSVAESNEHAITTNRSKDSNTKTSFI